MPEQVLFTPAALDEPWGQQILSRVKALNLPVEMLPKNRLTGLRGETERETYAISKRTLAVVNAPPSSLKLSPIPPSADWQFHLAEGCPAHCQYCYLAGSLSGPPVIRAFANLPQTLQNLGGYERPGSQTSFEVSCYTDPLGIEHLTGSLAECIRYFGSRDDGYLRWVSKFDGVDGLLDLPHNGGYPVGLVIAPIMPIEDWEEHYDRLFEAISAALNFDCDLTFELISHRFTPGSKEVLQSWYPNSKLEMDESKRVVKRNKFGGTKYVYDSTTMKAMRQFFEGQIHDRFPQANVLYWT